jgi:hypothetical protein
MLVQKLASTKWPAKQSCPEDEKRRLQSTHKEKLTQWDILEPKHKSPDREAETDPLQSMLIELRMSE